MLNCIIVDDEQFSVDALLKYIGLMPELNVVGIYTDPLTALKAVSPEKELDLLFMDIDMPNLSGLELAGALRSSTRKLVFTTAYTQYGYEAFEVNADAYLLKPYSFNKFAATVAKLFPAQRENGGEYFFVKDKEQHHQLVRVNFKDIIAVESKQNYIMIYATSQKILTYMSLTEITGILNQYAGFVKYHRSYIINREHIGSITGNTLKMINGLQITVGESYRKEFTEYLEGKLLKAGRRV